ncbi:hypothetical protein AAVH_20612 [Aphelenchoides avenae]|nr:hypothetical protein AAVH_20612 [Aphelenchus avenae]
MATTAADEQGYFELQGKVSDAFSSPEPYLKINGGCKTEGSFRHSRYCIDLVEQTYGLPCASDAVTSLTKEGEVIVYKSLRIELDGRSTRPRSFC